ncbi:MAG TPA: O-antigen ligase family protein [Longimicrobiales bacterium]
MSVDATIPKTSKLYELDPRAIWRFIRSQPASYWLICVYLFFEYVRPQQIYDVISGWPFASWVILLCAAVYVYEGAKLRPWNLADGLLGLFTLVVLLSSALAYSPSTAFGQLQLYVSWVLIYLLITHIVTTNGRFLFFFCCFLLFCTKMSQHGVRSWAEAGFGFRSWGTTCAPGWFQNSGECGIQMAMFAPLSFFFILALRPYWGRLKTWVLAFMPFSAVATIVASSSRGAVLGLAGIALWMLAKSRRRLRAMVGLAALAALVLLILPPEQKERFNTMGDDKTSTRRITYWKDGLEILGDHPVLGIGYKNWLPYYRSHYNPHGQLIHNIFLEAATELGYVGLGSFILLILATFVLNRRTRKLARRLPDGGRFAWHVAHGLDCALIGFMVSGFFVTVLYYPFFWINLAMTSSLYTATLNEYRQTRARAAILPGAAGAARVPSGWRGGPPLLTHPGHGA